MRRCVFSVVASRSLAMTVSDECLMQLPCLRANKPCKQSSKEPFQWPQGNITLCGAVLIGSPDRVRWTVSLRNLSTYRKKRDFEKTDEPSGDVKVAPSKHRRFVIQKHDATRLHYDLRLEFDGVFKSWAVTRGPSLDPHDKRLAVEVEDHPLDYGDFEGTIPKSEYGGGTVQLWDRGYWESEDPEAGYKKGDLKFTLC